MKEVSELVEWAAGIISIETLGKYFTSLSKQEQEYMKFIAKQILSHPDLALIDRNYRPTRLGDADKEFRQGWKYGQESLTKQNYYRVIPLAEALKEE